MRRARRSPTPRSPSANWAWVSGRDLVTDNTGEFRALQVPPGRYYVTVQGSGFATVKMTSIHVDVGATETVRITLKVAAVTEEVTVSGQTPVLETEKTEVSETLSHNLVSNCLSTVGAGRTSCS